MLSSWIVCFDVSYKDVRPAKAAKKETNKQKRITSDSSQISNRNKHQISSLKSENTMNLTNRFKQFFATKQLCQYVGSQIYSINTATQKWNYRERRNKYMKGSQGKNVMENAYLILTLHILPTQRYDILSPRLVYFQTK